MKNFYKFFFFILASVLMTSFSYAQPAFWNNNTGNSTNSFPLNTTSSNKVQSIYGPGVFSTNGGGAGTVAFSGNIDTVYIRMRSRSGASTYSDFTISLGQNVGTINSWPSSTYTTGLTQVLYHSSFTLSAPTSHTWVAFALQNPFPYDPTLSLVLELKVSGGTGHYMANYYHGNIERIWGGYAATSGSSGGGLVDFGFDLSLGNNRNDIGVTSIDSPAVFCEGNHNIVATVKNFGINQVDSFTLNWSLNNILQTPIVKTNLVLDTNKGAGSQTAQIILTNKMFTSGMADTIKAWTSLPNNVADTFNKNDTSSAIKQPAIFGNYTIDSAGTGPTNYKTFSDAAKDLSDFGVCGPVTYTVASGIYPEQVLLDKITGTSSTNTITFTPDTAGSVTIEYSAGGTTDNYVVKLNGASWVSFDGFNFRPMGSSYSTALEMNGGSSHNTFKNCLFDGNTSVTGTYTRVIYCQSAGNDYNLFENNDIIGGYYGIYFYGGGSTSRNVGNEFIGNRLEEQYYRGTYIYYSTDLKFNYNTVTSTRNYSSMYPVYNYYANGASEVIGNFVNCPGYMGMYLGYYEGNVNDKPLIANNVVRIGKDAGTAGYGLYCYGAGYARIVHNTIVTTHSSGTYYGMYIQGGANTIMNNNYYELNGQSGSSSYAALYVNGGFAVIESDYNNFYTNRQFGYLSGGYTTLQDWQNGTGFDMHSYSSDPGFTNFDSLRTCSDTLDGAGTPLSYVTDDFDGDGRNPVAPDIGADEWVGADSGAYSAGPDALVCNGEATEIGLQVTGGTFLWNTADTTSTISVTDAGTYTVVMTSACGAAHTDTVEVSEATAIANFNAGSVFLTGDFVNTSTNDDSWMWVVHTNPADTFYSEHLTYLFADNGPYQVDLHIYNDCDTDMVSKTWTGYVGINENSLENSISLMPNPATDVLNIQFDGVEGDVTVEMLNIQGQVVHTDRYMNVNGNPETIVVSSLKKGMYIVKFITDTDIATKQVIVQ